MRRDLYPTLDAMLHEEGMAFVMERDVRARYPHDFPCDIVWWMEQTVAAILSLDVQEGTGAIQVCHYGFDVPWEQHGLRMEVL